MYCQLAREIIPNSRDSGSVGFNRVKADSEEDEQKNGAILFLLLHLIFAFRTPNQYPLVGIQLAIVHFQGLRQASHPLKV